MSVYIFSAPAPFWSGAEVDSAVRQALEAARRIGKGVDVTAERSRLAAAIESLDRAITNYDPNPRLIVGPDAKSALEAVARVGMIRLPFNVPQADGRSPGFYLTPVPFAHQSLAEVPPHEPERRQQDSAFQELEQGEYGEGKRRLSRNIEAARRSGRPVPIGTARHPEITLALRAALWAEAGRDPFTLHLVYGADGSESGPIVLGAVSPRPQPRTEVEFNVALMSCRHFEIDADVDLYLLRNSEIDRQGAATFRDQEELAFKRVSAFLDSHIGARGLHLRLFHTGLEPAVVGAYRAIIGSLRNAEALVVTPIFHGGRGEEEPWW